MSLSVCLSVCLLSDARRTLLKAIGETGANTTVAIQGLQKDITTEAAAQELWRQKDRDKNTGERECV